MPGVIFCGLLIGAAILLFIRSIRAIFKGRCCEDCRGCPHIGVCESGTRYKE